MPCAERQSVRSALSERFEQRFRRLQIGGVEAQGEPAVDVDECGARLFAPTLLRKQAGDYLSQRAISNLSNSPAFL